MEISSLRNLLIESKIIEEKFPQYKDEDWIVSNVIDDDYFNVAFKNGRYVTISRVYLMDRIGVLNDK